MAERPTQIPGQLADEPYLDGPDFDDIGRIKMMIGWFTTATLPGQLHASQPTTTQTETGATQ